jgi:glc operon protein GlcG
MHTLPVLTLADAQRVLAAVETAFNARFADGPRGAAFAVVDAHGELIAFLRTDKCALPSIAIAQNKAYTAARQRDETYTIGRKGYPMTNFGDLRYCPWGGGVPLVAEGVVVGAVGVSGLPEDDDVTLARAGAAAL